jgi:DNA-binding NarL/FixJ family response regulator
MVQVQIVDDHKVVVEGLEKLINDSDIAKVIDKAYNIADCWKMLEKQQSNVLLLDIGLPDGDGIDLCGEIKQKYPEINILMLTSYAEQAVIMRAFEAGALGYILKNSLIEEIIEGIETVAAGKKFLCEEVNLTLKNKSSDSVTITRRERELLGLIVKGHSNSEIAETMCLGYETIRSYRKNLILKLNAHNTALLVKIAIERKLV